ncbi:hypothetical protein FRB99_007471 [Tulasnella sp. 403]|nr:hypothetical protein FRB99_007471 [Tulasnella sp. 403]
MLLDTETFWLSNTPFSPSRYPGAGSLRIANVTRFALADSPQTSFALINTHLDDWSEGQRKLGASLLLARARFEAVVKKCAVFITGDFNSEQSGHDSRAYRILTGAEAPVPLPEDFNSKFGVPDGECPDFTMIDLRGATPRLAVSGFFRTFTGFQNSLGEGRYGRIDYILGGSNRGWESQRYKTANIVTDDGLLSSDHRPVYADVSIRSLA